MILSLLFLALSIAARSVAELALHGKLKWSKDDTTFWGRRMWNRKYKWDSAGNLIPSPNTYYYKLFNLKYKERWPTSATFTVFATDGMHLMQFFFFSFLSLAIVFAIGFDWRLLLGVWIGIRLVHGITYWLLSK
jgi:hypothetical protein